MTKTLKIFSVIAVLCVLIVPNIASAQFQLIPNCALGTYNEQRGIYEQKTAPDLNCVEQLLVNIAQIILGISGAIALLMFIYGGFLWLTAGGNSSKVQQGTKIMIGTVIGLIIIFAANLAVTTVRNVLVGQGLGTSSGGTTQGAPSTNPCVQGKSCSQDSDCAPDVGQGYCSADKKCECGI